MTDKPYYPDRSDIRFYFSAIDVKEAAGRKLEHHRKRWAYWHTERAAAEESLKGSVEFREHEVTGGKQLGVMLDPEKQAYLNLCATKMQKHEDAVENYKVWVTGLRTLGSNQLSLSIADIRYFGLQEDV